MAASSDRNPPPFPAAEDPEPGLTEPADGDSDEGEDIFVSKAGSTTNSPRSCESGLLYIKGMQKCFITHHVHCTNL
uniref:Sorting nexin N-terminal domain-containing protein n=1 Tax=Acanthochromis polyacanthus TaxID=80966 RepID=A0A3Q1GNR1_9TELE